MTDKVWVLMRNDRPHSVYTSREELDERVSRIANRNPQYPLTRAGQNSWIIGPSEDEGFFGQRPVHLTAIETPFNSGVRKSREQE